MPDVYVKSVEEMGTEAFLLRAIVNDYKVIYPLRNDSSPFSLVEQSRHKSHQIDSYTYDLYLPGNDDVVLSNIPDGTSYTIEEIDLNDG